MAKQGRMSVLLGKIGVSATAVGVLLAAGGIGGHRLELLPLLPAFGGYAGSALLLALGALVMLVAMIGARGRLGGWKFNTAGWIALVLSVGMTLNNLLWLRQGQVSPMIHDVTTDTVNPPVFVDLLPLRAAAPNPPEYAGPEAARLQLEAYPEITTLALGISPAVALERAERAAGDLGWEIVTVAPGEGRLEAVATTAWFGFKDDVVVRITPDGAGALVDVRSKSRVGLSDVGTNARRIRHFLARM